MKGANDPEARALHRRRGMRSAALLIVTICTIGTGCTIEGAGVGAQPIIGGSLDTLDPAVSLLVVSSPAGTIVEECTAVLISPHVALTGAHCVSPDVVGANRTFRLFLGADATDKAQWKDPTRFQAVVGTAFDPGFNAGDTNGGHDVGVVILETAAAATPIPVNRAALAASHVGEAMRLIGYGQTNGANDQSTGVKAQVTTPLSSMDEQFLRATDSAHTFCRGDSGGPALLVLDGIEQIVGLSSFKRHTTEPTFCESVAYFTRVDTYAAFFDPFVAMADPPPAPDLGTTTTPESGGCTIAGARPPTAAPLALMLLACLALRRRQA